MAEDLVRTDAERACLEALRSLFADVPRAGIYRMLAREIGRMARERPRTLLRISNPRRGGA